MVFLKTYLRNGLKLIYFIIINNIHNSLLKNLYTLNEKYFTNAWPNDKQIKKEIIKMNTK